LDLINLEFVVVDTVGFDNRHGVVVDGKSEVGIAGYVHESESVSLSLLNRNNCQLCRISTIETTEAIDESRVLGTNLAFSKRLL
jgi:hypothetical protein